MSYHPSIAIGHFSRTPDMRGQYRLLTLLNHLWMVACSCDVWADSVTIHVAHSRITNVMPDLTPKKVGELGSRLARVGALEKVAYDTRGVTYRLIKPSLEQLDAIAREQAEAVYTPGDYMHRPEVQAPAERGQERPRGRKPKAKGKSQAQQVAQRRREILARLDVQRSDIAALLAKTSGVDATAIRYGNKDGHAVNAAIDWADRTGADADTVVKVCKAAHQDTKDSGGNLTDLCWLFETRFDVYRKALGFN